MLNLFGYKTQGEMIDICQIADTGQSLIREGITYMASVDRNDNVRVLIVIANLNIGGAQAVAANISKYASDNINTTYLVFDNAQGEYEEEIKKRGNTIIHFSSSRRRIKFFFELVRFLKSNSFDVVHSHIMYYSGIVLMAARIAGVKGRFAHSHTSRDELPKTVGRTLYKWIARRMIHVFGTDYLACGIEAGNELYGKKWFSRYGKIIKNGIEFERYCYNPEAAAKVRRQYGWTDRFIIGHVGHYVRVKNQAFLINLLPQIIQIKPNTILLMFGEGEDRKTLETMISQAGLNEYAKLMGNVNNICDILSAFDVFAFPSLMEGTPLALIEAQANMLPCIISDQIPKDACLTDQIIRLPLDAPELWVAEICNSHREPGKEAMNVLYQRYETAQQSMDNLYRLYMKYAGE